MDTNHLKKYAPKARRDFIEAVTRRAARFGITEKETLRIEERGELYLIGGEAFSKKVAGQRRKLVERVRQQGFHQAMEAIAYTWFNRLAAICYMELHGYLNSGYRVLSHPEGKPLPEILEQAEHVDLPGLGRDKVIELKLDGTRDEELYRDLLLAQCHALHQSMPFLFEAIDDETELLLPDNLLQTDSLIRDLVSAIPEEAWQQVEIIGWLYQFYISEKKDQVIGKVVKSEDIPAATQLFTPDNLNPEKLTLIDPACGSGHILTEAYDLFKAIYLERGYRQRDIPKLILEKNLFGLDIDGRAAQLSGFALMMKGRADDRRLIEARRMRACPRRRGWHRPGAPSGDDVCVAPGHRRGRYGAGGFLQELGTSGSPCQRGGRPSRRCTPSVRLSGDPIRTICASVRLLKESSRIFQEAL